MEGEPEGCDATTPSRDTCLHQIYLKSASTPTDPGVAHDANRSKGEQSTVNSPFAVLML